MRNCRDYLDYVRSIDHDDWAEYANEAKDRATTFVGYLMGKARGFSVLDFAVFKVCLLSAGLWLGATFSKAFGKLKTFLFVSFIASWLYLLWRIFLHEDE